MCGRVTAVNDKVEGRGEGRAGARRIVHRYVGVSAVAGLITVPALDVVALGGVHVALIKELTDYYGAEFSEHTARNILIAITAGLVPGAIGSSVGRKALSVLPFVTHGAGLLVMSAFSAGVSYALGNVFIRHFEAGGTLDSFNPQNLHRILLGTPA
jgi:uncharacterized protein (DUF697 family)